MSADLLKYLPQQWVGLFALLMFFVYIALQVIEKSPAIAKIFPLGTWWHERQNTRKNRRGDWLAEDNQVILALQEQVKGICEELAAVRETLRSFTAWSIYDARWHHKVSVDAALTSKVLLPDHLDYFEFEKLWKGDPMSASKLP